LLCLFLIFAAGQNFCFAREEAWYKSMPAKAKLVENGKKMRIGNKTYPVYNAFDPIAPQGGERVLDNAGVLDYYFWYFKLPSKIWTLAIIDLDFNIYYMDEETQQFTSPAGITYNLTTSEPSSMPR